MFVAGLKGSQPTEFSRKSVFGNPAILVACKSYDAGMHAFVGQDATADESIDDRHDAVDVAPITMSLTNFNGVQNLR